jgi:hypothetical protein
MEIGEKAQSTAAAHVHRNQVAFKVWKQFMQKPLRKTP